MSFDGPDESENESTTAPDEWEEFRQEDSDPIRIEELKTLPLQDMPEDICIRVMDDYFPDTTISREGEFLIHIAMTLCSCA